MPFKKCTACTKEWKDREEFLSDPEVVLAGYQVHFEELTAGFFLFQHRSQACGTSIAIDVDGFTDLHHGPVFEKRLAGTDACEGHCLRESDLLPCPAHCECAFVRDIMQIVREWPKRR